MQTHELLDTFRSTHPTSRDFTRIGTIRQSGARLDRWLISSSATPWLQSVQHAWGAPGDHAAVVLTLTKTDMEGPFHWPRSLVFSHV
jgi:exonuclease III